MTLRVMSRVCRPLSLGLFVVFLSTLSACGKSDGSSSSRPPSAVGAANRDYELSACTYRLDEGYGINREWANRTNVQDSYFGKKFDFAPLQAVLYSSAQATLDYFQRLGVRYYKVVVSDSRCNMFSGLSPAPADVRRYWDGFSGKVETGQLLEGLYLHIRHPEAPSVTQNQAAIVIRQDASRWTILHEFMHHLFEVQAEYDSHMTLADLHARIKAITDRGDRLQEQFRRNPTRPGLMAVYAEILPMVPLLIQLELRSHLEEVANEWTLLNLYLDGHLKFVPFNYQYRASYGIQSAGKARIVLNQLRQGLQTGITDARKVGMDPRELGLERAFSQIDEIEREIDAVAPNPAPGSGAPSNGASGNGASGNRVINLSGVEDSEKSNGCPHSRESEAVSARALAIFNR